MGLNIWLLIPLVLCGATLVVLAVLYLRLRKKISVYQQGKYSNKLAASLAELNPNPIMRFNEQGRLVYANKASNALQEYWNCETGKSLPKEWLGVVQQVIRTKSKQIMELEFGDLKYYLCFSPVQREQVVHLYAVDLTEFYTLLKKAQQKSLHDSVTGLPNRLLLIDYLKMHIERLRPHCHVYCSIVYLNNLAELSASMDVDVLNQAMVAFTEILEAQLPEEASVGRLSEQAFMIINSEFYNHGQAISLSQKVLDAVSNPIHVANESLIFNSCVGISVYPDDTESPEMLLRNAKLAQSRAVAESKPIVFYQSGMDKQIQTKRKILVDLHRALEKSQLMVYYQPQMSLSKRRYIGAEALLRWKHPEQGFISPFFFVSAAEESGLIVPIGRWVMQMVCRDLSLMKQKGIQIKVAINLSAVQFLQDDLVDTILELTNQYELTPEWLEFEITEGVMVQDIRKAIEKMHLLRQHGFSLSIDDFGTGYSSLSYLQQFPIQKLKIDRAFIKDMHTNRQSFNMTRGIIELGHSLNLNLVAEGVEKKEQVDMLYKMKCDIIQGYYYSQPVPYDQFVDMIQTS